MFILPSTKADAIQWLNPKAFRHGWFDKECGEEREVYVKNVNLSLMLYLSCCGWCDGAECGYMHKWWTKVMLPHIMKLIHTAQYPARLLVCVLWDRAVKLCEFKTIFLYEPCKGMLCILTSSLISSNLKFAFSFFVFFSRQWCSIRCAVWQILSSATRWLWQHHDRAVFTLRHAPQDGAASQGQNKSFQSCMNFVLSTFFFTKTYWSVLNFHFFSIIMFCNSHALTSLDTLQYFSQEIKRLL